MVVVLFASCLGTELLIRSSYHDNNYYQQHGWPKLASFLIAASVVRFLISLDEGTLPANIGSHPRRRRIFRDSDQLFYISVKHWPMILCGLGVVFYFVRG